MAVLVKKTETELKEAKALFFQTSQGLKYLHKFSITNTGTFTFINKEWVQLTCFDSNTTSEEVIDSINVKSAMLEYKMDDFDILKYFIK